MRADPDAATSRWTTAGALPAAVLWDLDGTLVDSAALWRVAYHDLAARQGTALPPSAWPRVAGLTLEGSVRELGADLGVSDVGEATTWLVDRAERLLAGGATISWRPGAPEALETVRAAGVPSALVTTSWRRWVVALLARLDATFDAVVCGDEVARGKPAPDGYLLAAERLDVEATRCVAVEDSATGVAAAEAAGVPVLVVPSGAPIPRRAGRTVRGTLEGLTVADLAAVGAPAPPAGGR